MTKLKLASLAIDSRKVEFDFPGLEGFKVTLCYQSRSAIRKLQEKCQVQKFDDESGLPYQTLDMEQYNKEYTKSTIVGWTGLTVEKAAKLMLIDESMVEDPTTEIEYDAETAVLLVKESSKFDNWVTEKLTKIDNFRAGKA